MMFIQKMLISYVYSENVFKYYSENFNVVYTDI